MDRKTQDSLLTLGLDQLPTSGLKRLLRVIEKTPEIMLERDSRVVVDKQW